MLATHDHETARAWAEAIEVHHHLLNGGTLLPTDAPIGPLCPPAGLLSPGECVVGEFVGGIGFHRFTTASVRYVTPRRVAVGPAGFVAAAVVTGALIDGGGRRRAHRAAQPQWRNVPLHHLAMTTQRTLCAVAEPAGLRWIHLSHSALTNLTLTGQTLTASFSHSEPLRLTGAWVRWCAAVMAHYRFGRDAFHVLPELQGAVGATGPGYAPVR